jgi:putative membrane protein
MPGPTSTASLWDLRLDLPALVLSAALTGGYLQGVRRTRARGLSWPWQRSLSWALGVATLLLVTVGSIGASAHLLLWVFTLQTLTLLLVTPVLLAGGRPLALAADSLDEAAAGRVLRVATAGIARPLTSPLLGPLLIPVVLGIVYFTPLLSLALQRPLAAAALRLALLCIGALIGLGLVGDGREHRTAALLGVAVAVNFVDFLADAIPGIAVRLQTHLLADPDWVGRHRSWGPTPLQDQQHAGALLWFAAEAADLPFLLILVRRWIQADERDAAAADTADDAADDQGSGPLRPAPTTDRPAVPELQRPWWETDPSRLAGHRMSRDVAASSPPDRTSAGPVADDTS